MCNGEYFKTEKTEDQMMGMSLIFSSATCSLLTIRNLQAVSRPVGTRWSLSRFAGSEWDRTGSYKKSPAQMSGTLILIWRRPTLPQGLPSSTIGAVELNCRVRNGIGCNLHAMTTRIGHNLNEQQVKSASQAIDHLP